MKKPARGELVFLYFFYQKFNKLYMFLFTIHIVKTEQKRGCRTKKATALFLGQPICSDYLFSACEITVLLFIGLWGRVAGALLQNMSLCPLFILTHCIQYTARPIFRQSAHEFCISIYSHLTAIKR